MVKIWPIYSRAWSIFVFVLVPPLARDLGLTEIQTSSIFAISAVAWALTVRFGESK